MSPCAQAEESGENTQLLDDALYALQGLGAGASAATRQDCALALADIAASQRGRRTLRCRPIPYTLYPQVPPYTLYAVPSGAAVAMFRDRPHCGVRLAPLCLCPALEGGPDSVRSDHSSEVQRCTRV